MAPNDWYIVISRVFVSDIYFVKKAIRILMFPFSLGAKQMPEDFFFQMVQTF